MTDEAPPPETPHQRALRIRKAALEAKPKTPGGGAQNLRAAAGQAAGASKPWVKK